jgi:TetR/AcrR family transcriptional regulator, transcriptional repressor for nem operon
MPLQKITKEQILDIGLEVFRKNGYHCTAMSDLASACGLQKGSFYHYFASKEALLLAILDNVENQLQTEVFPLAYQTGIPARERMDGLLRKVSKTLLMKEGGCIVGNLVIETALTIPVFAQKLKGILDAWQQALAHIFSDRFSAEMSKKMAEQTVMEFEGAAMLNKIYQNEKLFTDCYMRVMSKF